MANVGDDTRPAEEMEIVGEVILGENREEGTVINNEEMVEGRNSLSSREEMLLQIQESHQQQDLEYSGNNNISNGILDLVLTTVQSYMASILFPYDYPNELRKLLTDQEIDELALFQGHSVESYFEKLERSSNIPMSNANKSQLKAFFEDGNHIEWNRRCMQLMSRSVLHSHHMRQLETHREKLRAFLGSWSSSANHCSRNIYLLEDELTAHRIPMVNHSDAVRGKLGVSKGIHAWDIKFYGCLGTHCSVGVALRDAPLMASLGYISMIGNDEYSWGWDIIWGNISHGKMVLGNFPSTHFYDYTPGDTVRLILDCDNGKLSYAVNDMGFGIAFEELPIGATLYPTVGLVYGNLEVSLVYLGTPPPAKLDIDAYCEPNNNNCDKNCSDFK